MNRDNHAGKIDMFSWLGGFFDGEGYIGIRNTYISSSKCKLWQPVVIIVNTDRAALDMIAQLLGENGCKTNFHCRSQHLKNPTKWRPTFDLGIYGITRVKRFIELIDGYCFVKKNQIDLVKEFINYRLTGNQRKKYGKYEEDLAEELKRLKHI